MKNIRNTIRVVLGRLGLLGYIRKMRQFSRQRALRAFYGSLIVPGDLFFDIGSHAGSRIAIARAFGARVVAAEPQPKYVKHLQEKFGGDTEVIIVPKAVGAAPGRASLHICSDKDTVSTLSDDWKNHGRFSRGHAWESSVEVDVTTLDELIRAYGMPAMCKIDVEGYEAQVLEGLHAPIPLLSFEFAHEFPDAMRRCIKLIESLGAYKFNYVLGNKTTFELSEWVSASEITTPVASADNGLLNGDIYARIRRNKAS